VSYRCTRRHMQWFAISLIGVLRTSFSHGPVAPHFHVGVLHTLRSREPNFQPPHSLLHTNEGYSLSRQSTLFRISFFAGCTHNRDRRHIQVERTTDLRLSLMGRKINQQYLRVFRLAVEYDPLDVGSDIEAPHNCGAVQPGQPP
jgi:hypothetical protein